MTKQFQPIHCYELLDNGVTDEGTLIFARDTLAMYRSLYQGMAPIGKARGTGPHCKRMVPSLKKWGQERIGRDARRSAEWSSVALAVPANIRARYYGWLSAGKRKKALPAIRAALHAQAPEPEAQKPLPERIFESIGIDITPAPMVRPRPPRLTPSPSLRRRKPFNTFYPKCCSKCLSRKATVLRSQHSG